MRITRIVLCLIASFAVFTLVAGVVFFRGHSRTTTPKATEHYPHSGIESSDPYALLAEANRLSWLMNSPAAQPLYQRAKVLFHEIQDQRKEAYAHIGELATQTESAPRSELSRSLAIELQSPAVQSDPKLRLFCLTAKAYADVEYNPVSAEKLWTQALATARTLNDRLWITRTEGELAILAILLHGDRDRATRLFGRTFFAILLNGDTAGQVRLLGILGNALNEIHRYAEASMLFDRAIRLARENSDLSTPFLSYEGKAEALMGQERFDEAARILNGGLTLAQHQHNGTHESALRVLVGKLDEQTGDRKHAVEQLEQAAEIARHLNLYRMLADSNFELAKLYTMENSTSKATECATAAVRASHRLHDHYFPPRQFSALAALNVKLGNLAQADFFFRRAEDYIDQWLSHVNTSYWATGVPEPLSDTYIQHFKLAQRKGDVAKALEIIERIRGRPLAITLGLRPALATKSIERAIANVQLELMDNRPSSNRGDLEDRLSLLEQQLGLTPANHVAGHLKTLEHPASLPVIQRALRKDEEVLEYVLDDPAAFCLAITKTKTKIVTLERGKAAIEELTHRYLARIRAKESDVESAKQLYSILVSSSVLAPHTNRLIIVPDGKLHFLPFEALIDSSGEYLLRSHVVSYAPSASLFHFLRTSRRHVSPQQNLLAVGAVLYQNDTAFRSATTSRGLEQLFDARVQNLPSTAAEVLAISKLLPKSTVLIGAQATEEAFKKEPLADFRILHLALHGVADDQFPERAALIFGHDAHSTDDGLLQVQEILALRLNADLVTLSACDTASGKLEGEEGVSSLEAAFFAAGAHSVVASLWTADDTATTALMEDFYRHLIEGIDTASALRAAKLDLLRKYGTGTPPFYWAEFIFAGGGAGIVF